MPSRLAAQRGVGTSEPESHVHVPEERRRLLEVPAGPFGLARSVKRLAQGEVAAAEERPQPDVPGDLGGLLEGYTREAGNGLGGPELAQDAQRFGHEPALMLRAGHGETALDVGDRLPG